MFIANPTEVFGMMPKFQHSQIGVVLRVGGGISQNARENLKTFVFRIWLKKSKLKNKQ